MNRRSFLVLSGVVGGGLVGGTVLAGCQQPGAAEGAPAGGPSAEVAGVTDLADPGRLRTAEAVISSFENSSTELPYASAQDIGDGRGITAGRAGFTSGTHDLLLVVRRYEESAGGEQTPLTGYLSALTAIDAAVTAGGDGSDTTGLEGFPAAWRQASQTDPRLNRAQDDVYRRLYFDPAMAQARRIGMTSALGQLVLLDSAVQHGTGTDPDGLATMIDETTEAHGGAEQPDRSGWLEEFLEVRRAHLLDPADAETAEVWRRSVPRVDTLETLVEQERFDLATPLNWTFAGQAFHFAG
jgi:chitosanase